MASDVRRDMITFLICPGAILPAAAESQSVARSTAYMAFADVVLSKVS